MKTTRITFRDNAGTTLAEVTARHAIEACHMDAAMSGELIPEELQAWWQKKVAAGAISQISLVHSARVAASRAGVTATVKEDGDFDILQTDELSE